MTTRDANIVISIRDGLVDEVFTNDEVPGKALIIDWDSLGNTPRSLSVNCSGTLHDFDFDTRPIFPVSVTDGFDLPVVAAMAEIDRCVMELEQNATGLNLDAAETSTVLAALRHFQKLALADPAAASETYADIFEDGEMLSVEEIDELCMKISLGEDLDDADINDEDGDELYGDEDDVDDGGPDYDDLHGLSDRDGSI